MFYTKKFIEIDPWVAEKIETLPQKSMGRCASRPLKENPYEWFTPIYNQVCYEIGEFFINEWWFNVTNIEDEFCWHTHNNHCLTAVLYIRTPPQSGGLEFKYKNDVKFFQPNPGDFIIFSGNIQHRVRTNYCDINRISVAFNINSPNEHFVIL